MNKRTTGVTHHPRSIRAKAVWLALLAIATAPWQGLAQFNQQAAGGAGGTGSRQYLNNTMVGDALIEVDPETRSVIVIADEETNEHIGNLILNLDQPKPQVLIKVVFLEVTHRDGLDVGVELGYQDRGGSSTNLFQSAFGLAGQTQGGLYQLFDRDFNVTMKALAETGSLEILSRPSILARNNQEAVITVGQEVPFIRDTRILQDGQQLNTVEYEDIGIILRVTPFITREGMVEMIVAPEISTITDETVPVSAGVDAPVFAKRSAETVVVTPDRTTVVIGGMMQSNKTETVRKVPLLGDIPILGHAFRRKVQEDEKTELMIFLTPYIVSNPYDLAGLATEERNQSRLSRKAFSEEDLDYYIDGKTPEPKAKPAKRSWFRRK